jgi:hypothetical protein
MQQRIFGRVNRGLGARTENVGRKGGGERTTANAHEDDEEKKEMVLFCIYCT